MSEVLLGRGGTESEVALRGHHQQGSVRERSLGFMKLKLQSLVHRWSNF